MAFEGYSKPLPCRTIPYLVISVGLEYSKIDLDGTRNTVSTNRLTRVAKEEMTKMKVTFNSKTNTNTNPVPKAPSEEEKNYRAVKNVF